MRVSGTRPGRLSIAQEVVEGQQSSVLVARLQGADATRGIPPLYGVTLAGLSSARWVLHGFEQLEAGPMRKPCRVGQTWLAEPVAVQDLIDVETKWSNAVREAKELREQVRRLSPDFGEEYPSGADS